MFRGAENVFLNDMCYVYLVATPGLWYKGQVNGLVAGWLAGWSNDYSANPGSILQAETCKILS